MRKRRIYGKWVRGAGFEPLEARRLLSAAASSAAPTPGLTDAVYHGNAAYPAGQVPNPNPNSGLTDGTLGGTNAAVASAVAYAASHTPNYTFVNSNDAFVYSGGSGALTENFLNNGVAPTPGGSSGYGAGAVGDAAGAALTDPADVDDTIFDAEGYLQVPTSATGGPITVEVGGVDDLVAVYMGGNGTPGSGTLVASAGWQGANAGTPGFTFNVPAGPDPSAPASVPIEIIYANGFGGANLNPVGNGINSGVGFLDQFGDILTVSYQTTPTNEPLAVAPTLSGTAGNDSVALNWNSASFAQTYSVYRYLASASPSTAVQLATGLNALTYTDSTAQNNQTYDYYVTADNSSGSTPSNTLTEAPVAGPTGPVTLLTATRTNSTTVQLSFTAPTFGTNYTITRSTTPNGTQTTLTPAGGQTGTTFTDSNAPTTGNTNYYYTVTSVNSAGSSPPTTVFVGQGDGFAADYYSSNQPDPNQDGNEKPLTGDASNAVLGFERIDPSLVVPVTNPPPGWNAIQQPYNVNNDFAVRWTGYVEAPVTGYYTFSVNNVDDREQIYVYDTTNLTNGSPTPVNITLAANSQHTMTGYGDTYVAPVVDANGNPYQFVAGQQYLVQVDYNQGYGGLNANLSWAASSTAANQAAGTYDLMTPESVPTDDVNAPIPQFSTTDANTVLTGTPDTQDQSYYNFNAQGGNDAVILTWDNVNADSYNLYRATSASGPYTKINTSPIAATNGAPVTYTDSTVTNGTTYYYILTGVDVEGETAINTATGATAGLTTSATPLGNPPATPTGVVVVGTDGDPGTTFAGVQGHISFPSIPFATSYIIQRAPETSPGSGTPGTFTTVPNGGAVTGSGSIISFADTDPKLNDSSNYFYQVIAVNSSGDSAASTPVEMKAVGAPLASEGTVEVDVQASGYAAGTTSTIVNVGNQGGLFNAVGGAITVASTTDGNNVSYQAFQFNGSNSATSTFNAPADLTGNNSRSIEIWVDNPSIDNGEETMVSWAHRGGPNGTNESFSYGNQYAVGQWGGTGYDLQWTNTAPGVTGAGAPVASTWHYLVFTYDGTNNDVYVDGQLYLQQPVAAGGLSTVAGFPVNLAAQNTAAASGFIASTLGSLDLASVRIEGGALTASDVANNYAAGVPGQPGINFNPPAVTGISPTTGPAAGGTTVTITGTGFTGATGVNFGTTPASSFTVNSTGTQITAVDPAGSGTVDVTVVTPGGTSATSSADQFTYTVSTVSISSVVVNGNNSALAGVQRSMVNSIEYTFAQAVILNQTNAFSLAVHSGQSGTVPTLTWTAVNPDASGGSTQWVVSFSGAGVSGGSIANGVYDITLNAAGVSGESGGTLASSRTDTFYRLFGDAQGTKNVSTADYNAFLSTNGLKSTAPGYLAEFAADGSGKIDTSDYNAFLADLGKKLTGFTPTI